MLLSLIPVTALDVRQSNKSQIFCEADRKVIFSCKSGMSLVDFHHEAVVPTVSSEEEKFSHHTLKITHICTWHEDACAAPYVVECWGTVSSDKGRGDYLKISM